MKRTGRRSLNIFSLSFMDCICCGFGAVILLFVLNKDVRKGEVEHVTEVRQQDVNELNEAAAEAYIKRMHTEQQTASVRQMLVATEAKIEEQEAANTRQQEAIDGVRSDLPDTSTLVAEVQELQTKLQDLLQKVEQERNIPKGFDVDTVGGIQADSEYVIILVDTSGSMVGSDFGTFSIVHNSVVEILSLYPDCKGIQLMTADGAYMGDIADARRRIPWLNPQARSVSSSRLRGTWYSGAAADRQKLYNIFSRFIRADVGSLSSPNLGIEEIVRSYRGVTGEIAIYIVGDDFHGNLSETVNLLRRNNRDGKFRVHAVGIPSILYGNRQYNIDADGAYRFANAMRVITSENGGAFVGRPK